jgi:hypothetical protein
MQSVDYAAELAWAAEDRAQRYQRNQALWDRLRALEQDQGDNAARELEQLVWEAALDEEDQLRRRLGALLIEADLLEVWQLVYQVLNEGCTYVVGDELDFVFGRPRRSMRGMP